MKVIKTTERTLNLKIKEQVRKLFPKAKFLSKIHVASVGYVWFVKDEHKNTLGKVFKDNQGMTIYIG